MQALYSEESLTEISRKLNRRFVMMFVVLALLLAVFVYAAATRTEWLAIVSACVAGCFGIFFAELFCAPLLRYRRLIRTALTGRHHEKTMEFSRFEPDVSVVDGVACRSLIFLGDPDKHGSRDMLLYWDNELPLPQLESGETVTVKFSGRNIIGLQKEAPSSRL